MKHGAVAATTLLTGTFALFFSLATYRFSDDHFHRISSARQVLRYGERAFRDFFDPGYVLTEGASAAVQLVFGDNLFGEMMLNSAFVVAGALAIFLLARQASGSLRVASVTTVIAVFAFRRPYDYDKFLFYPLGLLIAWRYVETRRRRELIVAATTAVVAGMFRYDNALFVAAGVLSAIVALHVREPRLLLGRVGLFLGVCMLGVLPYALFLNASGSVSDAVNQIATYARREGARTGIASLPRGALSEFRVSWLPPPSPDAQESWRRRLRRRVPAIGTMSISWSAERAADAAYYLFVALSVGAAVTALRPRTSDEDRSRVLSAVSMTGLAIVLILREPVIARIGGMIGPPAVLAAWMWHRFARWRAVRVAVTVSVLTTLAVATEWRSSLHLIQRNGNLFPIISDALANPPSTALLPKPRLAGLVEYLRRCTQPEDRVFAAWFVPELYFFSGRAFAGGMVVTFGDHWSEPEYQHRIVAKMKTESVPVVLLREGDESFARGYPIVAAYLSASYRTAGSSTFGGTDGGRYAVFTSVDRTPTGTDAGTSMPCFARAV